MKKGNIKTAILGGTKKQNVDQHVVPKWHLRQFTFNYRIGLKPVYFYDIKAHGHKIDSEENWIEKSTNDISVRDNFYDAKYEIDGQKHYNSRLDEYLQEIENFSSNTFYTRIKARENISDSERLVMTRFIASMIMRTTTTFEEIKKRGPSLLAVYLGMNYEKIVKYCQETKWKDIPKSKLEFLRIQYKRQTEMNLPENIDESYIKDLIVKGYEMTWNGVRYHVMEGIEVFSFTIYDTIWKVFYIDSRDDLFFISSDRPAFVNTKIAGQSFHQIMESIKNGETAIGMPLSKKSFFVASRQGAGIRYASIPDNRIADFNREIATNANEFIISPKKGFSGQEYFEQDFLERSSQ